MRLSREKIQRMIDASGLNTNARRSGGGGGAGGGGGVSSQWVDDHYVSKEFFARLFTINGTDENDDDVVVEPNDLETTITNIQMMVGAWTEQYLSALGLSDGGSGGGGVIALQDLVNVEYVGTPSGGQILKYNGTTGKWYNADDSGDYLPLTGGTLTGNLSVKGTHDLSLANNGISQTSYLGYYIKDTNNKRSAQYINTVSANGNNSFWMSVTYNVSGSTELDKGFGLIVDKQGNCTWRVDGAPEFRSAIGINLDNLVTTNTAQTISAAKLFSGGITPIAAGSVQTVSAGSKIWFKRASVTTDNTPNNGIVLEYGGSSQWVGQLYMADNGQDGLYWGGWFNGTRQSWMKILDTSSGVTLTTDQTITGTKTFSADVLHANNTSINFNNTSDTACSVLTLNSSNSIVIGWGVRSVSDTYITGRTIQLNVGGNTPVFYATNGENVGIGTVSPGAKLDVNGQMRATTYLSCHNVVGENGTAGWVCFAIVAVSSAWATQPLKFKVSQRGRLGGEITLRFAGVAAASNTTVQEFSYTGNIRAARVVKNGANFSLYIQKHEEYDDIAISLVNLGTFMSSKVTVTWTNSLSSSDPGGTAATCRYYFSNTAYMEWDETNSAVHFVNAGVYSDTFVSALGANSSGGGGGTNLNTLLTSLNSTSLNPATVSNKVLVNSSGTWTWQDYIAGGGGSVMSVDLSMPTGFSVTGGPITGIGTFTVTANGTIVPNLNADKLDGYEASGLFETLKNSTASGHTNDIEIKIGNTTKYLTVGYATSAGSATTAGSASTAGSATTAESCTGNAATASKLSGNASGPFTAWGNTFWNNGVPQSVSGDMSNVGNITAMTESNNYTKVITGFHSLTLRHNGSNGGHLDFFWNGASSYTSRIIEGDSKRLDINNTIFVFHTSSSSNAGCVGIGTTNPGFTLNVNGYTYTHRLYLAPGVYLKYDNNGGVHLVGAGFYADTFVSALGANSSSGGGGIDLNTMWNALENNASGHSIGTSTNGLNALYATSIYANGVQVLTSSNGVTIATAQTISGAKTFSGNLLAKKIQMTASNAATYLEHTKLYSPNATMTIQGSDSAQNLTLCTGGGNVSIGTAADANYRLKVSGSSLFDGNVGIGGYNSSYKLYVSGTTCTSSLKVNSTYEFVINWDNDEFFEVGAYNREIHAIGSWYGSWRGASDIRKKNVVSKVDVDVAQISELPIFNFTWKNSADKDTYLGTSAQEVKKLFPSAVSVMSDGMLGMAYGETALAAAVMTARKVVDHEARIKRLEKEFELLKAMQS